jgi:hypothetical protein
VYWGRGGEGAGGEFAEEGPVEGTEMAGCWVGCCHGGGNRKSWGEAEIGRLGGMRR